MAKQEAVTYKDKPVVWESISGIEGSPKREKICRTPVPGGFLYRHSVVEYTRTNAEQLIISIAFVSEKDL